MAAGIITRLNFGKTDVVQMLNGAIGGLVAITAEPLMPSPLTAILIGGAGGVIVVYGTKLLLSMKIDDVVGAIPAHLVCGIWGTLIVPFTNSDVAYSVQAIGVVSVGLFVVISSGIIWSALKFTIGLRVPEDEELAGLDKSELGMEAYPDFSRG